MAITGLRFDLRNPPFAGVSAADRYRAALDMAEWADRLGFTFTIVSEHHGSDDGYLPSAVPMAAAIAARTENVHIKIAAIVGAFHDPLKLAEDLAVVDLLARGRLDVVVVNGYVAREFEMFGCAISERVARANEVARTLRAAWTGEPFDYRGRTVRVTPAPHQPGGPPVSLGGATEAGARRAARLGFGFMPTSAEVWTPYREEMLALGNPDPGPYAGGDTSFFHLTHDVEAGWKAIAPYAMHEVNAYGEWMAEAGVSDTGGYAPVADADALRATGQYRAITPDDLVAQLAAGGPFAVALFHPMMGGIPPEMAWESLRLFEHEVLPRL